MQRREIGTERFPTVRPHLTEEYESVQKLPSLIALSAVAALLGGCSATVEESTTTPSSAPSSVSSVTAATSATRSVTPSPTPTVMQPSTASPAATAEASSDPAPTPANTAPETTAPVPAAPAVPAPTTEEPVAPAPATEFAVTPGQKWGEVTISVPQEATIRVDGSGYESGQQITLSLGIYQSDGFVMDDQVVHADAAGNYSTVITLAPDLEPRTYGLLVYISDGELGGPEFEASKRSVVIEVVAS